jgi:bacteriocin biosynthesis cyclodehydratase domain-containing protein
MTRWPRLALPFTVLTAPGVVRLVAGEDFRYSLSAPNLDEWLPGLLARCEGRLSLDNLLRELPEERRAQAKTLLERLYGERVLVDGTASDAHHAGSYRLVVEGQGPLIAQLSPVADAPGSDVHVICQDRLDLDVALRFNRRRLEEPSPWLWVSSGAMARGYVSPVFLPDAGPCLHCLLRTFRTLSPAPELYDALLDYVRRGQPVEPVPFPEEALTVLAGIVRWKVRMLSQPDPPAALYRLHVVEADSLEVSTHRVFRDPECPDCGRA